MDELLQLVLGIQLTLISLWVLLWSTKSDSSTGAFVSLLLLLVGSVIVGWRTLDSLAHPEKSLQ